MPQNKRSEDKKRNDVMAKNGQKETAPGYGDKKIEGPDRPST
ncbi:hypothetical protein JOD43_001805 [Pullulanibacillus pueri]|uniref:Uncharacterized protein n=1 Tax=Pullulanibacillus pueri TaxID=1437324 RepID=A0A8J3EM67_9BACL|nr:hypothetical protein [Pullulanibacillus pueri]MBM7681638.1 hypothetical protein [Pullulanibacillus pueri]GGH79354.1 hypothetical protein GCM10007096_14150 [Pullulanibacillus pueri]